MSLGPGGAVGALFRLSCKPQDEYDGRDEEFDDDEECDGFDDDDFLAPAVRLSEVAVPSQQPPADDTPPPLNVRERLLRLSCAPSPAGAARGGEARRGHLEQLLRLSCASPAAGGAASADEARRGRLERILRFSCAPARRRGGDDGDDDDDPGAGRRIRVCHSREELLGRPLDSVARFVCATCRRGGGFAARRIFFWQDRMFCSSACLERRMLRERRRAAFVETTMATRAALDDSVLDVGLLVDDEAAPDWG